MVLPEAVDTRGVGLQLLVLGIAVVAEAILHGMLSVGIGKIHPGLIVLSGVVPWSIASLHIAPMPLPAQPMPVYWFEPEFVKKCIRSPAARGEEHWASW